MATRAGGFPDSQGTTFTYSGQSFACTNVKKKVNGAGSDNKIDVSTLDLASGAKRVFQDAPLLDDPNKGVLAIVSISFLGMTEPVMDTLGVISCAKLGISGNARCTSYELEAAVGEVLKGTAEFSIESADAAAA